ncbi:protein PTHB1 [Sinocyclocheilus rhinocerous]|uniref:protein PTHB1 n=1 Tax=Sinocyclocheilus rhinocerous TaxID=307959 RepID=UPI0007B8A356|nr:PREDICTED: protein PTHB1-like [Sinocyclocheilus rhinocerous]
MSLFKARDWWASVLGEGEEFDQGCLCVGDVDNSGSGYDKIVVGSFMGMLRIFSPHPAKPEEPTEADAQLLEVQLPDPIIQVDMGKFVSICHMKEQLKYRGHHFICIQSMDGMLMFFEQETYAFGRFLPGFLLPGPLSYCIRTDSFITVSSTRQVECYRYETLAVATDADTRQDSDQQSKSSGKRLTADWTLVLGEEALDICVPNTSSVMSSIFVLGERNFFGLKDNGQIRFMKKLEFNPSCFLPYGSVSEGSTNILMCNHNNMLLVYQDVTLKWAAQLSCVPVAVRIANFPELRGLVVTLSSDGHLQCSYMGTDPSFFTAPKVDAREVNYDEVDTEMKMLQKVIREATKTQDILPRAETEEELTLTAIVSSNLDEVSCAVIPEMNGMPVPSVTVKVKIKSRSAVQSPKVTVCVQPPLAVTQDQFVLDSMGSGCELVVRFSAFLNGHYPPADLCGDIAVSYSSATELNPAERYRIQSESFEDIWLVAKELVQRFVRHFASLGAKDFQNSFTGPIPLPEYFETVDHHFELRVNAQKYQDLLSERAVQFRAIQRRLLTRFKDKTPGPLQNLDTLMEGTYRQVIALADAAEDNRERLIQAFTRLRSATHLLILLLSLWQGLGSEQTAILEATLLPLLQDTPQLGWEESVDAAVSHLLKSCLSRSPKDQAISLSTGPLTIPKDMSRLKKHITLLCDRLGKGGRLSLTSEANVPTTVMMPVGCESIPEPIVEQEEEPPLQQDAAKYIKKKQPSKRIKSKSDSSKESSREKKEKDSGKEKVSSKESKRESSKESSKRESTKESKEPSKDRESTREKESSKESGKEKTKVSRKSSVKVKEKKSDAGDG